MIHPAFQPNAGPRDGILQADNPRILWGAANYAFTDGPSKGVVTILRGLQQASPSPSLST